MIQIYSNVGVADNTGARLLEVIRVHRGSRRRYACIGDMVTAVVKVALPDGVAKKKEVVHAVIVRQRNNFRRSDGTYIKFDENSAVLLNKGTTDMRGTRIFGPIPRELRERGFQKIISLAPEVL